jgi:hypothetical protein
MRWRCSVLPLVLGANRRSVSGRLSAGAGSDLVAHHAGGRCACGDSSCDECVQHGLRHHGRTATLSGEAHPTADTQHLRHPQLPQSGVRGLASARLCAGHRHFGPAGMRSRYGLSTGSYAPVYGAKADQRARRHPRGSRNCKWCRCARTPAWRRATAPRRLAALGGGPAHLLVHGAGRAGELGAGGGLLLGRHCRSWSPLSVPLGVGRPGRAAGFEPAPATSAGAVGRGRRKAHPRPGRLGVCRFAA